MKILFYIVLLAFSVWMLYDAWQRRAPFRWYLVILFVPFGALIYYLFVKMSPPDLPSARPRTGRIDELRQAFAASPTIENRQSLAQALADAGRHEEARREFEAILESRPSDRDALLGAGISAFTLGDHPAAIRHLDAVVTAQPSFAGYAAWLTLGEAKWALENYAGAIESMERLCRVSHRIDHQLILARCYLDRGRKDDARAILNEAAADYERARPDIRRASAKQWSEVRRLLRRLS